MRRTTLLVTAIGVAALALAGCSGGTDERVERTVPAPSRPTDDRAAPDPVVARAYMGVSCRPANTVECDRVGLSVWLRRPALRVSARIGDRPLRLDDPTWSGPASGGRRTRFAGFLQPAGLLDGPLRVERERGGRWTGRTPQRARVDVIVSYGGGRVARTSVLVRLSPGWG